jgi:putative thioredoxin
MLFGMSSSSPKTKDPNVFDVTADGFEDQVLKESITRPVLVDFWAPWCGPCKQLGPTLEAAVAAQGGKVALAKVNVDENPELAQAFRVQSIPMVVAMYQGQPVSGFAGARPKADIDNLIAQLVALAAQNAPDTVDIPSTLKDAAERLDAGDLMGAQELYAEILAHDENNTPAYVGLVRVQIAAGQIEQARQLVAGAPESIAKDPNFAAAKTALELAQNQKQKQEIDQGLAELEARVIADPNNLETRFDFAESCYAKGWKDAAVDALIEIIRRDRTWQDDKARTQLLKYFEAWGFTDPASVSGRKKLSSVLFS